MRFEYVLEILWFENVSAEAISQHIKTLLQRAIRLRNDFETI